MKPPELFSWSVVTSGSPPHLGAVGVTDDRQRALVRLGEALRDASPGARGLVHRVTPSFGRCGYFYGGLIARGALDPGSDAIVWQQVVDGNPWGGLGTPFFSGAGDSLPPEAVAAGFADLDTERERRRLGALADDPGIGEL